MGRRVVAAIAALPDHDVVGVDRSRVDLCDLSAVDALVAEFAPDAVVHLASIVPSSVRASSGFAENVAMMSALARACERNGVGRVVFASSSAVYGDANNFAVTEEQALDVRSDYAQSKVDSEEVLARANVESVALRIFNVFGPGFDDSLVHRLLNSEASDPVRVRDLDRFVRDYVHVDDVVEAALLALHVSLPTPNVTVNVGTGVATSNRELIRQLSRERELHFVEVGGDPSVSFAETSFAMRVLSFRASRTVTHGA
ncbi:MAG: NAD-dependent epimerase/dehydratase family protein [Rhodoglobus sp.]